MDSCSLKLREQEQISKDLASTPDHHPVLIKSTLQRQTHSTTQQSPNMTDSSSLTIGVSHVGLSVMTLMLL
jgi:hypothetical protein